MPASTQPAPSLVGAPVQPRAPWWQRVLLAGAASALALTLTFVTALFVFGCLPILQSTLEQWYSAPEKVPSAVKVTVGIGVLLAVLTPAVLLSIASRRGLVSWRFVAAGWLVLTPVLAWLRWDEAAIRHPLTIEELSPAGPNDEQGYTVVMRYGRDSSDPEAAAFQAAKPQVRWTAVSPTDSAKWLEFVRQNREGLQADWVALAPQRRWLAELHRFGRIGDLTPPRITAPTIQFQVWRALSQRTCAQATLLALDGKNDEAIETLVPLLECARWLQVSSRTLVRSMIGLVVERMCLEAASLVLDQGAISATSRARLLQAIGRDNPAAMARRLVLIEYAQFAPTYFSRAWGDQLADAYGPRWYWRPLNPIGSIAFNPNRTMNLHGSQVFRLAELASQRELGELAVQQEAFARTWTREISPKNLIGRVMLHMASPAFSRLVESHWKTADRRAALQQRLER